MRLDGNEGMFGKNDPNRDAELGALGLSNSIEGPLDVIDLYVFASAALRAAEAKRSNEGDKTQETINQIKLAKDLYGDIEGHIIKSLRSAGIVTTTEAVESAPKLPDNPES